MDGIETEWKMIIWDDITSSEMPWMDQSEASELRPAMILSVGTVVNETDEFLTLAGSMGTEGEIGNVNCIPKACIRRQVTLFQSHQEPAS